MAKDSKLVSLKATTRHFIKNGYDSLNNFSQNSELMDFIGGELISRKNNDGTNITILHMTPLPTDSVISMVKGPFDKGTMVVPQLFREERGKLLCIWQGKLHEIETSGTTSLAFDTPLHALAGDHFALYFPERGGVPYSDKTGNFAVYKGKVDLGAKISDNLSNRKRNYSMGITGFLE